MAAAKDSQWPKINCLAEFASADLPVPHVWKLSGADLLDELHSPSKLLLEETQLLCSGPLVIRTDVSGKETFLLNKLGGVNDPVEALSFMQVEADRLRDSGVAPESIAFIAHRYIRSRACAWTFSSPTDRMVKIDSTWGLNDGLSWLPHDTAWVNPETGAVRRSIDGKTNFLDAAGPDNWTFRPAPTEWIWRASATEDQLRMMATGAQRLASQVGKPIVTMWFVGLLEGAEAECLPWFQAKNVPTPDSETHFADSRPRTVVRSGADLDSFAALGDANLARRTVLQLRPNEDLVRDKLFLERVIAVCAETGAGVELVGSSLAHPFYMLQSAGVPVICVGSFDPGPERYNKLVRDRVPAMIAGGGEDVISVVASGLKRPQLLQLKLVEEALEVLRAETRDQLVDELADLDEVARALRAALGIPREVVRSRARVKREARGGFDESQYLVSTGKVRERSLQLSLPGMDEDDVNLELWRVRSSGGRVAINMLPPFPGDPFRFLTEVSGVNIGIVYTGTGIELEILGVSTPVTQTEQLFNVEGDA